MVLAKILIIDDEAETRKILKDYLSSRLQCDIIESANGYDAIEELKKQKIDVVLTDIKMPGIRGTDVIEKTREMSTETAVIVLTKWDSVEVSKQVKESGADYIPKPFSLKVVLSKVEEKLKMIDKWIPKGAD